jgi:uncharacterized protein (DUF2147 family)
MDSRNSRNSRDTRIMRMVYPARLLCMVAAAFCLISPVQADSSGDAGMSDTASSPVGVWQTIDDKTGQPKALVQISQDADGTLSGKIVKGLGANDQPDRKCDQCTDSRKDQPMLGMTIVDGMKRDGDKYDGGRILDPENGSVYKCQMHTEDKGQKLVVRGYIGISLIGRSQTWNRQH